MSDDLGIAILGASSLAKTHAAAWTLTPKCKVRGIFSENVDTAEQLAKEYNSKTYKKYEEALEDTTVQVVDVCLSSQDSYDVASEALSKGKHLMLKPTVTSTLEDFDDLTTKAEKMELKVMVDYWSRYSPLFQSLKSQVENGQIGVPKIARICWFWSVTEWKAMFDENMGDKDNLPDLIILPLDLLRWFLDDDVLKVYAVKNATRDTNFNYMTSILTFSKGITAYIEAGWTMTSYDQKTYIDIAGTKGTITLDNKDKNVNVYLENKKLALDPISHKWSLVSNQDFGYYLEIYNFAREILGEKAGPIGVHEQELSPRLLKKTRSIDHLKEARKSLALLLAALKSAEIGEVVKLT